MSEITAETLNRIRDRRLDDEALRHDRAVEDIWREYHIAMKKLETGKWELESEKDSTT